MRRKSSRRTEFSRLTPRPPQLANVEIEAGAGDLHGFSTETAGKVARPWSLERSERPPLPYKTIRNARQKPFKTSQKYAINPTEVIPTTLERRPFR